ncbi:MAG: DUF1329 domain-containing protein [Gammaproteobacteria bacterium]|uniref:Outer membrane lipoprotein-sorting protein n=2 Tax=Marinobacter litoralis TaxID=187981 RepID=A0A3M2RM14_9GAMM|nr:DUF1329 domain-containing protein [Marinobacter litoralis]MBR9871139.1 DUF1329 domain-containing protein [Gammaproteobacteria bacterium]RMJ06396.1 hypothetical protein DOQ08_01083 [Marinobacter litoralis]
MKMIRTFLYSAVASAMLAGGSASAAVSQDEAAKLGDSLTPMGAIKAGNGNEIPAWDGGLVTPPANYKGDGRYVDPFPNDKELFRIDQSNVDQYADKLTPGQVAMIKTYDSYFIPVYETRRTGAYPEVVQNKTKENATNVSLIESGNGLSNYQTAIPFPIPQNGLEAIFNHITRYRGGSVTRNVAQVTPQPNGDFSAVKFTESFTERVQLKDYDPSEDENVMFYFKQTITAPSRLAGNVLLVHETINQVKEPRRAWLYNSGQRRVRRAPSVAYDGPGTAADGQRTSDNLDLYNGAPDKYNWELKGRKELYIPYNSYRMASENLKYKDIIKPGHVNQELARYELHRVWHVTATLKDGERHVYKKRDFYIDEDTWQIAVVDHYDGRDNLWRVAEAHAMQVYDARIPAYAFETLYDLLSGRYLVMGMTNEESDPYSYGVERSSREYTPAALRRAGVR